MVCLAGWKRPRSWRDWLAFVVFDLGTVVVSITDVITDVTVAISYWNRGYRTFFILSSGILGLASCIFSIMFVGIFFQDRFHLHRELKDRGLPNSVNLILHGCLALLLAPFGQAFPVIMWAIETFYPLSGHQDQDVAWRVADNGVVELVRPVTAAELEALVLALELDEVAAELLLEQNVLLQWQAGDPLREYLKQQAAKHAPFVAEAISESIPQSLLQLVALIVISQQDPGQVNYVSILSISLSILSIISKSYICSLSMARQIFVFKMTTICYDGVALFYIFASLFLAQPGDPLTVTVRFLGREMDGLSAAWVYTMTGFVGWLLLFVCLICMDEFICEVHRICNETGTRAKRCSFLMEHLVASFGFMVMGAAFLLPVLVLLVGANVSLLALAIARIEEGFHEPWFPFYNRVLRLLQGPDFKSKLRAYNQVAIRAQWEGHRYSVVPGDLGEVVLAEDLHPSAFGIRDQQALNLFNVCADPDLSLSRLRQQTVSDAWSMLLRFNKQTRYRGGVGAGGGPARYPCFVRFMAARTWFFTTYAGVNVILFVVTSAMTVLYPVISLGFTIHRHIHVGWGDALDGARLFQLILFTTAAALFCVIAWLLCGAVPRYIKCLWHMTPMKRTVENVTACSRKMLELPDQCTKSQLLEGLFRKIVQEYSKMSGRSERDIVKEVDERAESKTSPALGYAMELVHILSRAA